MGSPEVEQFLSTRGGSVLATAFRFRWVGAVLMLAMAIAVYLSGHRSPAPLTVLTGETMGTTYRVILGSAAFGVEVPSGLSERAAVKAAEKQIQTETESAVRDTLEDVNAAFSTYDPESELSHFNTAGVGDTVAVSPAVIALLQRSLRISEASNGSFDPTVGSLVNRWQFGPGRASLEVPGDDEIAGQLERTGFDGVEIDEENETLTKLKKGLEIDLSAMAKGHGVDRVAVALAEMGYEGVFAEIGGEIVTRGTKPDGSPWTVAVRNPAAPFDPRGVTPMPLTDAAMATSGDYFNFHEVDGQRYGHTIDPRTGRPVTHDLIAATVVAPDCATADALATALMVMGPTEGYDWAAARDVAAMLTRKDGTVRETPCFEQWKSSVSGSLPCHPSF